jgi:hypothetical protein
MKKTSRLRTTVRKSQDMLPEYAFDYRKAKPNRFAGRIGKERDAVLNRPNQRVGSISNSHVGADFERVALEFFAGQLIST